MELPHLFNPFLLRRMVMCALVWPLITVAIVDDDAIVRSALVSYVSATPGFHVVHECVDGAQAVATIVASPVDVVITEALTNSLRGRIVTAD